jgi:hypothetical protein
MLRQKIDADPANPLLLTEGGGYRLDSEMVRAERHGFL